MLAVLEMTLEVLSEKNRGLHMARHTVDRAVLGTFDAELIRPDRQNHRIVALKAGTVAFTANPGAVIAGKAHPHVLGQNCGLVSAFRHTWRTFLLRP